MTRLPLPDCHAYTYTHTHRDLHTHTEDLQNVIRRLVSCVVSCQLVIFQSVHSTGQRRACWDVTASKMESCHYFSPHLLFWFPKRQQTNKHINKQSYKHSQCLETNMKNLQIIRLNERTRCQVSVCFKNMIFYLILSFLGCSVNRVKQHTNISKLSRALRPCVHEVKYITNHVLGNISIICSLVVSILQIWGVYKDHKIRF